MPRKRPRITEEDYEEAELIRFFLEHQHEKKIKKLTGSLVYRVTRIVSFYFLLLISVIVIDIVLPSSEDRTVILQSDLNSTRSGGGVSSEKSYFSEILTESGKFLKVNTDQVLRPLAGDSIYVYSTRIAGNYNGLYSLRLKNYFMARNSVYIFPMITLYFLTFFPSLYFVFGKKLDSWEFTWFILISNIATFIFYFAQLFSQ